MERRRIIFGGHVQGVGFRATAAAIARSCTISGWVRNEADRSVLLEVQGERGEIDRYLGLLRQRMEGLIRRESSLFVDLAESDDGFQIRR